MPEIAPFDGLLFDPGAGDLREVTAPPYDVILPHDLARYRASAHNVARIDLGESDDAVSEKYTSAGVLLRRWRDEGILRPTGAPSVYAYEMRFTYRAGERRVRGVIASVELTPWGEGVVPHERTMPGPVQDRLDHLRATGANLSPVYAVAEGPSPEQAAFLDRAAERSPDRELVDEEGVHHRVWVEPAPAGLAAWHRDRSLLIADGHHRYQTALGYREEMRAKAGPGPWDHIMMLVVDAALEDPPVLPIHRVLNVSPIPALPAHPVRDLSEILAWLVDDDLRFGAAFRDRGDLIHAVGRLEGAPPTVSALHASLLDRMPGLRDMAFVHDPALAEEAVHVGERDMALFLPPARVDSIRAVVQHGGRLPEKSTYFWPKPRTGLVIRALG